MKYIKGFIQENSYIKNIKFKKFEGTFRGYIYIELYNGKQILIEPSGDCPSISYIVEFKNYNFEKLKDNKLISLIEITSKNTIRNFFENIKPLKFEYKLNSRYKEQNNDNIINHYRLYRIKLINNYSFYFGLINCSDKDNTGKLKINEIKNNKIKKVDTNFYYKYI